MLRKYFILLFISFTMMNAGAQQKSKTVETDIDSLKKYELVLQPIGDSIRDGSNEFVRMDALTDFIPIFVKTLKFAGSFSYPFDSLRFMFRLKAPDNSFRMFNWILKFDDATYRYYAAIQLNQPGGLKLIPLYDNSSHIEFDVLEDTVLTNESWYGVQYYDIFQTKYKSQKYYILLGWDGNNAVSHKKVIEIMYFKEGKVFFGAPLFKEDKKIKYRKVLQYNANAIVTLKFHPEKNLIVFDHLVPPSPANEGKQWTYIPDGDYDYYKIKRGKFIFGNNVFGKYTIITNNPQ